MVWWTVHLRRNPTPAVPALHLRFAAILAFILISVGASSQSQFKLLYGFRGGDDGADVTDKVVLDAQGNIYGITAFGGTDGVGIVFELTPEPNNQWNKTTLYSFQKNGPSSPYGGMVLAPTGGLYGTTQFGGTYHRGTIFEVAPNRGDSNFTVLYSFGAPGDNAGGPWDSLLVDASGNLFGTGGDVFELSPFTGAWFETTIVDFNGENGFFPQAGLVTDAAGNLYGATTNGGGSPKCVNFGCGTIYELIPVFDGPHGVWYERVLHAFGFVQDDGIEPGLGNLAIDAGGHIYGTTRGGGTNGAGMIFKLTPSAIGRWEESVIYNFTGSADGDGPTGGVTLGPDGILYGTTIAGGGRCGCGLIYKLSPGPDGQWQYTVLHTFQGFDGDEPDANLTIDSQGNLYGTTLTGGPGGAGVVFELTP